MKKLPRLNSYIMRYGIKIEERGYSDSSTLIGFDTETIGNDDINVDKDIYSLQVVKNSMNEQYFYLVSKDEVGINMLDFKTEFGNYLFNRHAYVTAHNLEFDLGALLGDDFLRIIDYRKYKERKIKVKQGNVHYKGWKIKAGLGQSPFVLFRKKGTCITFSDSRNWFRGSLESIGNTYFQIKKKKKPLFLGLRPPQNDKEFAEFKEYAMQDARIQFLMTQEIAKLHEQEDIKLSITPAARAGRIFKKNFLRNRLFIDNNVKRLGFIWSTYHGARFEAIGRGFFKKRNMYDINSLYPWSMKHSPLNFSNSKLDVMTLNDVEKGMTGFCRVEFKYDDCLYPALPVRGEKLVFPLSGTSWCTTHELKNALKQGVNVQRFHGLGWTPREGDVMHGLGEFVDYKYAEKQKIAALIDKLEAENTGMTRELQKAYIDYLAVKLDLNSMYGKLAQRNNIWDEEVEKHVEIAGSMFKPDFASLITGLSRASIHDYMQKFQAIYCDTDSIITQKKLESDLKLGGMKMEYEDLDFLIIRSKLYFGLQPYKGSYVVSKAAKHGFRITKQDAYELLKRYEKQDFVQYEKKRMTKCLESTRSTRPSHMKPRKWVRDTFNITMDEDGKRKYHRKLTKIKDLLNKHTFSQPLKHVESKY